ncbi:sulfatase family protein [Galbibacter mesophilus]|uniref:sulfatase family protein n=1 Tax=Galbibacter mesophilus TaxID=379069 RepID=UPI00191F07DA|nr:sulfatase [Galbibacter mesophilus]MCM5663385.1 sulfatase [Galbibacter mesophilus]
MQIKKILQISIVSILTIFLFSCKEEPKNSNPSGSVLDKSAVVDYSGLNLPDKPNIVWIVAEDLSPYLPTFGDSTITTPNISRLAKEGVTYTNVYSPSGVCAPSRAALALGMYPTKSGTMHMRTGPWFSFHVSDEQLKNYEVTTYEANVPPGVHMHSEYLRRAGYYCTNNDKEDYQFRCEMTAWDESSKNAHWKNRDGDEPFFAIFNFNLTHESKIWAHAKDSLLVPEDLDVPIKPYLPTTEVAKNDVRRMYSNVKLLDQKVGEILKELEDENLLENTVIFWYSDHGGPLPREKRTLYDSGLQVPMIIRFPNKQLAEQVDDQLISFVDFKPTLLSLAGIPIPDYVDGRAWMGKHANAEKRDYIFAAADRFDLKHDRLRAVKDKRFKLIRNYLPNQPYYLPVSYREQMPIMQELLRLDSLGQLNEYQAQWFRKTKDSIELFDTFKDPNELHNLASDPKYKEKVQELSEAMDKWIVQTNDLGMIPEKEYLAQRKSYFEEPQTATPKATNSEGNWVLDCETEGASIGFQWIGKDEKPGDRWQIYQGPIQNKEDKQLVVRAHRIGFKPSEFVVEE